MKDNTWAMLLTGMPNSGKSTIAYDLVQNELRNTLIIDGDRHRQMQFLGKKLGFSRTDIIKNTRHVIKMAQFAQEQKMNVLIAQIAPYVTQRDLMSEHLNNFIEVYCQCSLEHRASRPNFRDSELIYEQSLSPDLIVCTDHLSVYGCSSDIMELLRKRNLV